VTGGMPGSAGRRAADPLLGAQPAPRDGWDDWDWGVKPASQVSCPDALGIPESPLLHGIPLHGTPGPSTSAAAAPGNRPPLNGPPRPTFPCPAGRAPHGGLCHDSGLSGGQCIQARQRPDAHRAGPRGEAPLPFEKCLLLHNVLCLQHGGSRLRHLQPCCPDLPAPLVPLLDLMVAILSAHHHRTGSAAGGAAAGGDGQAHAPQQPAGSGV